MHERRTRYYDSFTVPAVGSREYASVDEEINELIETIGKVQEAAMLSPVGDDLDEIGVLVSRLSADLSQVRQRGFVHQAQLDSQVEDLVGRWDQLCEQVADALYERQTELVASSNRLLDTVDRLYEPGVDRATVESCWTGIRALQSRIESAHKSLTNLYDDYSAELEKVAAVIDRVEWMLDQIEAGKFKLLEGEAPIRTASALWVQQGEEEGEKGLLHLTDQRILYEQKEERTTEKFLFVSVKKETIHELRFEAPVGAIDEVKVGEERTGFLGLGKAESLELVFDHTAPLSGALFHLTKDDSTEWAQLINRVQSGEIDRERTAAAVAEVEALAEAISEIPSNCPNCSAPLDQTVVRGMTEITCRFCASIIRI